MLVVLKTTESLYPGLKFLLVSLLFHTDYTGAVNNVESCMNIDNFLERFFVEGNLLIEFM